MKPSITLQEQDIAFLGRYDKRVLRGAPKRRLNPPLCADSRARGSAHHRAGALSVGGQARLSCPCLRDARRTRG
jgi:hypothetical protein